MHRIVEPELLDELPSADPRARRSRGDLRLINRLMGHAALVTKAFLGSDLPPSIPLRIIELGAGDGTLLLSVAQKWSEADLRAEVTLVDRQNLVSEKTQQEFSKLNWKVKVVEADVFQWLAQKPQGAHLLLCNLFLHHFGEEALRTLLQQISCHTEIFIGCEPERSQLALAASHSLGLIGCNSVTRRDAVISVRAGFAGSELSTAWPTLNGWTLTERPAGLFTHSFIARRDV